MELTPKELYLLDVKERNLREDAAQLKAVEALQHLYEQVLQPPVKPEVETLFGFFKRAPKKIESIHGVYLWGGVGRGKTFLIDSFFSCLPFENKRRIHFQRFMKEVHEILKGLPKSPDPLPIVAKRFAQEARLICLDEFHVDDVADAMLLAGLLQGLMDEQVVLVFTSNIEPDDLYLNGLQRQRFLPAIDLIKTYNNVVHLHSPIDYRVGNDELSSHFFIHDAAQSESMFQKIIDQRLSGHALEASPVVINQRQINTKAHHADLIWLSFDEICGTPKSYYDYLLIAEQYKTVMLSGIPEMHSSMDDVANRFIQLIDALYDQKNELIASAQVGVPSLYSGQRLAFPFQRTQSRLTEMFGEQYLQHAKKA